MGANQLCIIPHCFSSLVTQGTDKRVKEGWQISVCGHMCVLGGWGTKEGSTQHQWQTEKVTRFSGSLLTQKNMTQTHTGAKILTEDRMASVSLRSLTSWTPAANTRSVCIIHPLNPILFLSLPFKSIIFHSCTNHWFLMTQFHVSFSQKFVRKLFVGMIKKSITFGLDLLPLAYPSTSTENVQLTWIAVN